MRTWTWYEVRNTEAGEHRTAVAFGTDADVPRIDEQLLRGYAEYPDMAVIRIDNEGHSFPAGAQDQRDAPAPAPRPAPSPGPAPAPAPPPAQAGFPPVLLVLLALGLGYLVLN